MPRLLALPNNTSLYFNGSSQYVSRNATAVFNSTGYSVAFWVKALPQTLADRRIYAEASSTTNNPIFSLGSRNVGNNKLCGFVRNDTGTFQLGTAGLDSTTVVFDNRWHHIVWTDLNGTVALYVDGTLDATNFNYTFTGSYTLDRVAVGTLLRAAPANSFTGSINQVQTYTRALTATEALNLYTAGIRPSNGLFFDWQFNEGTGTTTQDTSGNNNTGTITGATWSTDVPSVGRQVVRGFGSSLNFPAAGNVTKTGATNLPSLTGSWSMALWLNFNGVINGQTIFGLFDNAITNQTTFGIATTSGGIFRVNGASGRLYVSTSLPPVGRWIHYTYTFDGTTNRLYTNGQLVATSSVVPDNATATLIRLSTFNGTTGEPLRGNATQAQVFNHTLTAAEVSALYTSGVVPTDQLVNWPLNESTGTTATDTSGNGNNGTISGASWSGDVPMVGRSQVQDMKASLGPSSTGYAQLSGFQTQVASQTQLTMAGWIKPNKFTTSGWMGIRRGSPSQDLSNSFYVNGIEARFRDSGGTAYTISSTAKYYAANQWQYVMLIKTISTLDLYINNQLVASITASGSFNGTDVSDLRVLGDGAYTVSNGTIAATQFKFWKTALTSDERTLAYNGGTPQSANLLVNWPLQEGAGTTAYDTSGNGNNGTITGATYTADTPSKKRLLVGGSLVANNDFSFIPPTNVAQTTNVSGRWIDGTNAGSTTNDLFKWGVSTLGTGASAMFDSTNTFNGFNSLKISVNAANAEVGQFVGAISAAKMLSYAYAVQPSTNYTLTYYMKTTLTSGTANGARVRIVQRDAAGNNVQLSDGATKITTTTGWTQYTYNISTVATARFATVQVIVEGATGGTADLVLDAWTTLIYFNLTTPQTRAIA